MRWSSWLRAVFLALVATCLLWVPALAQGDDGVAHQPVLISIQGDLTVPAGDEVVVEPLANIPVVSDLVVDMDVFYEDFDEAGRPLVRADDLIPECEPAEGIDQLERYEDCIECGICLSACPVAGSDPRYVGPAALAAAWRLVDEPRGRDPGPVLQLMDSEQAAWRCHLAWECSEACPSGVDPAGAIMRLRRAAAAGRMRRLFSFGGTR